QSVDVSGAVIRPLRADVNDAGTAGRYPPGAVPVSGLGSSNARLRVSCTTAPLGGGIGGSVVSAASRRSGRDVDDATVRSGDHRREKDWTSRYFVLRSSSSRLAEAPPKAGGGRPG